MARFPKQKIWGDGVLVLRCQDVVQHELANPRREERFVTGQRQLWQGCNLVCGKGKSNCQMQRVFFSDIEFDFRRVDDTSKNATYLPC